MRQDRILRQILAAQRRQERESQRQLRELAQRSKEQAKLSAIEQARLEVEDYELHLQDLLSVHKMRGENWDWPALAASLPPVPPHRTNYHEAAARERALIAPPPTDQDLASTYELARLLDDRDFQEVNKAYVHDAAEWESLKALANLIISGRPEAYIDALNRFAQLSEITNLGSSVGFVMENRGVLIATLSLSGIDIIPSEVKSLTSTGKLSTKAMSIARKGELYQEYISGCMLRVAREVFVTIPVDICVVTALAPALQSEGHAQAEQPILSAIMSRSIVTDPDFGELSPSEALENLIHKGDFRPSRRSGPFQPIQPLGLADVAHDSRKDPDDRVSLYAQIKRLRNQLKVELAALKPSGKQNILE